MPLRRFAATLAVGLLAGCDGKEAVDPAAYGRTICDLSGEAPADLEDRILFGDLHVHSSNSLDALIIQMPLTGGTTVREPSKLCDFARYCSQLDFFSINDHAEEQLADHWRQNLEAIRTCNDRFEGYGHQPDLVAFLGWEWTHNSDSAENDWGHRNVVLRHTCDDEVPARPFAAPSGFAGIDSETIRFFVDLAVSLDPGNAGFYESIHQRILDFQEKPVCDPDADTLGLPEDCHEVARDPAELYEKLARWDLDAFVFPHGLTWGAYHVGHASWLDRFEHAQHLSRYDRLVEIYSGHGNMEPYRSWRPAEKADDGTLACPETGEAFDPCCHRAGEIVRARSANCQADPSGAECLQEMEDARTAYLEAGLDGILTVNGASPEDWLDCGQCRDCFQPAAYHRPLMSVQTALALTDLEDPAGPWRYRAGFVGSTDSHRAGPGAGYKEFRQMSDGYGPARAEYDFLVSQAGSLVTRDYARQNSFFFAGGLVAVHARGRSREAIWEALDQRRVYATSGDRIEVWFDLVNGPGGQRLPMGSETALAHDPEFEVRALGAPRQKPGCPDWVTDVTSPDFTTDVCLGECYHPTGERHLITRIEVVKITPRISAGEPLDGLIVDPFLVLPCDPDPGGCAVTFSDPAYAAGGRPAAYYVRVIQEPTLQFNAGTLRCTRDAEGNCLTSNRCDNGYRGATDDCLSEDEERAWASPIYLKP